MPVTGNRIGNERYAALEIRDDQGAVSRGLVFSGPELGFTVPGPARPQRAVYQRDRVASSLCRLFRGGPEFLRRLIDQWRQLRYVPRDRGLVHVEYFSPYLFGDVAARVPARDDERLAKRQLSRSACSFIPRFGKQFCYALFQLVELLTGEA